MWQPYARLVSALALERGAYRTSSSKASFSLIPSIQLIPGIAETGVVYTTPRFGLERLVLRARNIYVDPDTYVLMRYRASTIS